MTSNKTHPRVSTRRPTIAHRLEFHLYKMVERILATLSMQDCVQLGRGVGHLIHAITPRYRRLVARNLRIATANDPLTEAELHALVTETFKRGTANFLGSFRTQLASTEELLARVEAKDMEILELKNTENRGLVVAMPHMGNWEALTQLGTTYAPERSYGGVYRPLNNPLMDEHTRRRRTADGAQLFSRRDGFHAPASMLRDGGALVVLADQRAGASGIPLPFFGKITTCSPLPSLMARRSKSFVSILAISTTGPARWKLEMLPVSGKAQTELIMERLEEAMRRSLPDVFWFHDRWRTDSARPLSLFTKMDPSIAARATVPLRLILSAPADAHEEDVRQLIAAMAAIRPDLKIERLVLNPHTPEQPGVACHHWDPSMPPEQCDGFIQKIDASAPTPLDGAILLGSEQDLARAAKRFGLRAIIGMNVKGKPWTRSLQRPASTEQWADLANQLAQVPIRHQS